MQVKATGKYLKISPKKLKLTADLIKGKDVVSALDYLKFVPKKASPLIFKVLKSALTNAEHNFNLKKDNLFIKEIIVNPGPMLKRWRARAFGRAGRIRKRSTHLSIILGEKVLASKIVARKTRLKEPAIKVAPQKGTAVSKKIVPSQQKFEPEKEVSKEIFDVHRKGKRRTKQHLDKTRSKKIGGGLRRIFRRKSI